MRAWMTSICLMLVAVCGVVLSAAPQDQGFQPATQLGEQLPATPLVFIAYAFCWVALIAYVFLLWRRLGRVERELAQVGAKIGARR